MKWTRKEFNEFLMKKSLSPFSWNRKKKTVQCTFYIVQDTIRNTVSLQLWPLGFFGIDFFTSASQVIKQEKVPLEQLFYDSSHSHRLLTDVISSKSLTYFFFFCILAYPNWVRSFLIYIEALICCVRMKLRVQFILLE